MSACAKNAKCHLNAHNFWQNYSNLIKLAFLDSSHQGLSNDILSDWFLGRSHFSIVFGNDIVMTSFLVTWASNLYILWNLLTAISLQNVNAVGCLDQVLQRDYKNTMITSLWRHFMMLGFEISIFCETGYRLSTCQVSNPSVIWIKFYIGFYRTPQNTIMTSPHNIWLSKLQIL